MTQHALPLSAASSPRTPLAGSALASPSSVLPEVEYFDSGNKPIIVIHPKEIGFYSIKVDATDSVGDSSATFLIRFEIV